MTDIHDPRPGSPGAVPELELLDRDERFRALVEGAPDGIFTQRDGCFAYLNPLALALFGCESPDQLVGKPVLERVEPRFHAQAAERIRILREERRALSAAEYQLLRLDGTVFWAELSAIPHRVNGVDGALAFMRDVTDRKRTEEKLARAEKMEALGTLAGGIAHDFNNLLVAIAGNAELARADLPDDHPTQRSLAEVLRASQRAAELVRQILTFSRRQSAERSVLAVSEVVEEAVRMLRRTLPASAELGLRLDADVPPVLADGSQLHQVLLNLVTNSAHAIGARPGRIEVRLARRTLASGNGAGDEPADLAPGLYAVLTVADDGTGIDPKVVDRIFDPFFTTKPQGEGTGLGLATALGIVRGHGGALVVESVPGEGAAFHAWLPAALGEPVQRRAAPAAPRAVPLGHGERVLFVDDEEALVLLAERALTKLGYAPATFASAGAALEAFRADPRGYAVVVSDLAMPSMHGLELLGAIRAVRPDVPMLLTSGYLRQADLAEAERLGVRAVIAKPARLDELARALASALEPES